jgi:hypothetical protein
MIEQMFISPYVSRLNIQFLWLQLPKTCSVSALAQLLCQPPTCGSALGGSEILVLTLCFMGGSLFNLTSTANIVVNSSHHSMFSKQDIL